MKQKRHNAILSLINTKTIETQSELTKELIEAGFKVTQATVSRDVKDLQIMKCQTGDGNYKYAQVSSINIPSGGARIRSIFANSVVNVDSALNQIVVKTLSGMAQAAAITIESMAWPGVIGTVGGDDTVVVVVKTVEQAETLAERLKGMLDSKLT